jgi:FkbM family methyltransferase
MGVSYKNVDALSFILQALICIVSLMSQNPFIKSISEAARKKIVDYLLFTPLLSLAKRLRGEIFVFNRRWGYLFYPVDYLSYKIMMLSHEGLVPDHVGELVRRTRRRPVFIDIGAHQGSYTLALHRHCRLVVAVEPDPTNYFLLKRNLSLNKVKNCIPVNYVVSSHDGFVNLYLSEFSDIHSVKKDWVGKPRRVVRVPARRIDTLLKELSIDGVDLVKIDVEGSEMEVLEGMSETVEKFKPVLLIEVAKRNLKNVIDYLKLHNYDFQVLYRSSHYITKEKIFYILSRTKGIGDDNL